MMADEPRRSIRATKGQHTKSLDLLDQPIEPKKKATKKSSKKTGKAEEEEEEVEVIRCVCGALETGDDDDEPWIACDQCTVWQHNVCVGISRFTEDAPANYLCEQCDPNFYLHKELLDGLKKGRKVWEERRKKDQLKQAEDEKKEGSKKKGKKGKGGTKRVSDISQTSHTTNGKAKSPSVPAPAAVVEEKKPVARAASTKRKVRDSSHDNKDSLKEPQPKVRKVSAIHAAPQPKSPISDLPVKLIDLEVSRQATGKLIYKSLQVAVQAAVKNSIYVLSPDDTVDTKSERLAIQIEHALTTAYPEKAEYTKQVRAVSFNLKQNQELCNGLLTRTLTPNALATMSSDDMASKELKRETAEMKARADKQSIMITDEGGPRVRRTHKGDEIVEGDGLVATDATSASRRRSMLDPNADMATRSRENSPVDSGNQEFISNQRSRDDIRGNVIPKQPLIVDTKPSQTPLRKSSMQTDFNINKIFSSVGSPTAAQHIRKPSGNIAPPANGPGVDPEIDKLLQDDVNDSPPYSPAEFNSDPDVIWRGNFVMDSIAKFPAVAKHVGGADLSYKHPWTDLFQKELKVAGRIDYEKANEYLCGLRYSPSTDLVVVVVNPTGEAAEQGYRDLFDYFHTKNRFGVLTNKTLGNIRDTYLVPVAPSPSPVPDFMKNLEGHRVPEHRTESMILVALVIRSEWHPDPPAPPRNLEPSETPSPSMRNFNRQMSIGGAPAMSPINPQGGPYPFSPIQNLHHPQQPQHPAINSQPHPQQNPADELAIARRDGEASAARILGPYLNSPTVAFLMPQAHQMRPVEWEVIRAILEGDEEARKNLAHLSERIAATMDQQHPGPSR